VPVASSIAKMPNDQMSAFVSNQREKEGKMTEEQMKTINYRSQSARKRKIRGRKTCERSPLRERLTCCSITSGAILVKQRTHFEKGNTAFNFH
jgi:hypothetical protein